MRIVVLGLALWTVAATAEAGPRNNPQQRWDGTPPTSAKPWQPYKPYSEYGEGSRSLTPRPGPQYAPGYKPYKPPFKERDTLSGSGGTFDRPRGTF